MSTFRNMCAILSVVIVITLLIAALYIIYLKLGIMATLTYILICGVFWIGADRINKGY